MRVAMAQVAAGTDPSANLETVRTRTRQAAEGGADLVVFPEAMMCRFGVPLGPVAEPLDGPWADGVRAAAREAGITVVAGMFTPGDDHGGRRRVVNTLIAAGPDGSSTHYDKIHLYDAFGFRESDTVAPGEEPRTITVGDVTVGLATCYDIRFPALFTRLAHDGARVVVVPTSWGSGPGKVEQWQVLTRARALDSSTVVVGVGQPLPTDPAVADSTAPTGVGHSTIADPYGRVLVEYDDAEQIAVHELDLEPVHTARRDIAVLDNARL
ncbi:carbon-nitrogen hydrolase family protein [uncultured Williamsia sp.]|uniref:carbon-nitrogen hydrolase family protein n=1 Tax=uncultured Williamsia sp. TaxID=259311 RepID=UPI002611F289|nr:carbon-nitrogen hydrolase family protein [uncultured Williamsia sp.]